MFKKISILSVFIYIIILFFLRTYNIVNNIETILLTITYLMLLIFLRHLFLENK